VKRGYDGSDLATVALAALAFLLLAGLLAIDVLRVTTCL